MVVHHTMLSTFLQRERKKLSHIKVSYLFLRSKQATQLSEFGQVCNSIIIFSAIKGVSFNHGYKSKVNREIIIRIIDAYRRRSKSRIRNGLVLQRMFLEQLLNSISVRAVKLW